MEQISRDQLKEVLSDGEDAIIINVLDRSDYQEHHIPGSVNIPMSHDDFAEHVESTVGDKGSRIVVYCASSSCDASEKAASRLEAAGFTNVLDYEEGMQGWEDAGLPVATGAAS